MQMVTGSFTSGGTAHNIPIGFIPDVVALFNESASTADNFFLLRFGQHADGDCMAIVGIADNGTTADVNIKAEGTNGPTDYGSSSISTAEPIEDEGFAGFTVDADFSDDGDVIHYIAMRADKNVAHGDLGA